MAKRSNSSRSCRNDIERDDSVDSQRSSTTLKIRNAYDGDDSSRHREHSNESLERIHTFQLKSSFKTVEKGKSK